MKFKFNFILVKGLIVLMNFFHQSFEEVEKRLNYLLNYFLYQIDVYPIVNMEDLRRMRNKRKQSK